MSAKMRAWVVSVAGLAAFGLVAYISVRFLLPALLPFVLALLFAMMIERPVAWLQRVHVGKYHVPRSAAVASSARSVYGSGRAPCDASTRLPSGPNGDHTDLWCPTAVPPM